MQTAEKTEETLTNTFTQKHISGIRRQLLPNNQSQDTDGK